MKSSRKLKLALPLAAGSLSLVLSQCVDYSPPVAPANPNGGVSLDAGPGSRKPTRYLENQAGQVISDPSNPADPTTNAPTQYQTPEDLAAGTMDAGANPDSTEPTDPEVTSTETTDPAEVAPPVPPKPPEPAQMPFGIPVPGKKGFVYSPYDKTQMVDVQGFPPGKKVRCPYTSKVFLVP